MNNRMLGWIVVREFRGQATVSRTFWNPGPPAKDQIMTVKTEFEGLFILVRVSFWKLFAKTNEKRPNRYGLFLNDINCWEYAYGRK